MIETHEQYIQAKEQFHALNTFGPLTTEIESEMEGLAEDILTYERDVLGIRDAFQINSLSALEWYIGKIADRESLKKRIQAQADAMIADVDREIAGLTWRFGDQAEVFLRAQLTGKKKSLKTLRGTIGLRKTPARVSVQDPVALLAELPDDLREQVAVTKPDTTILNRLIKVIDGKAYRADTGEEVAASGLVVKPESEKLYVKSGGDE